ncbi:MAG: alginate export family protein [Bacteroidota bacterium]
MNKLKILLSTVLIALSTTIFAQFTVDGEFRSRFSTDHGYKLPVKANSDAVYSLDQRSRLILGYSNEKLSAKLSLQDARVWGSDDLYNKTGVEGNSNSFGVYEAWVELKMGKHTSIRVGRQEWNYNDMRVLSWRNWWTSGLSYDGVLFKFHNKESGWLIDAGASYNNDGTRTGMVDNSNWNVDKLKTMNFLNVKKVINDKFHASLMLTLSGKQDVANNVLLGTGTHGLMLSYNKGKSGQNGFFAFGSAYYQHGKDFSRGSDGERKNIAAYLVTAELGMRTMEKKLEVSLGMELISGRDYSNDDEAYNNTRHTFDLMYSARFPYYGGHINYFLVQDNYKIGTKGGGYFDPNLKVNYKFTPKDILQFAFYAPMLTTKVAAHSGFDPETKKPVAEFDENGDPVYWEGSMGNHIDLEYTRKFSKEVILKVGASYAMVSDTKNQMVYGYQDQANKALYDLGNNYFVYTMLIVKPQFFSSK